MLYSGSLTQLSLSSLLWFWSSETGEWRREAVRWHWFVKALGHPFVYRQDHWGNLNFLNPSWLFIFTVELQTVTVKHFYNPFVWMSCSTSCLTWLYISEVVEVTNLSISSVLYVTLEASDELVQIPVLKLKYVVFAL